MPELSPVYTELRDGFLAVSPETNHMAPTDDLPHVYGAVIDIGFEALFTVAAFADGTTSVYNSTGGGAAALGTLPEAAMMSRAMLRALEAEVSGFKPVDSTPLPAFGRVRFTVLPYEGRLGIEVDGTPLLEGKHSLSKPFAAVMSIMDLARKLTSARN